MTYPRVLVSGRPEFRIKEDERLGVDVDMYASLLGKVSIYWP